MIDQAILPHSKESEQSLLGGILRDNSGIDAAMGILSGKEFYFKSHALIFEAILDLYRSQEIADLVTVHDLLERKNQILDAGGASYLAGLCDCMADAKHVGTYARIIRGKYDLRRIIQSAGEAETLSRSGKTPVEILRLMKSAIGSIESGVCRGADDGYGMIQGMNELARVVDQRIKLGGKIPGLRTGLEKLDKMTCGMFPQDLWVLAARPGQGKTALSLNITRFVAGDGVKVLWYSLDMGRLGLWERLLATESGINLSKIRSGNISGSEYHYLSEAQYHLKDLPIVIIDKPSSELDILQNVKKIKPGLLIIDHLTKIIPSSKTGNANTDYGSICKDLKNLAKETDIPILILCQLNRLNERENRAPKESDLRDSGEIEQDADTILFIHSKDKSQPERDLIIAKQRQGELAVLKYQFLGGVQRFIPTEMKR